MKKIINLVIIILCSLVFTSCSSNLTKTTYEKPYNFNLKVTDGENEWIFTYDERIHYIEYDYVTPCKKYYPIIDFRKKCGKNYYIWKFNEKNTAKN